MEYTQNFNIEHYGDFLQYSHKALKQYGELFHLVISGLNGMIRRYDDYCNNNEQMKNIIEQCNHSFGDLVNSISSLKEEHKRFETNIENSEQMTLGGPKTEIDKQVGDWLKSNMLVASEEQIIENLDYLNNTFLPEQKTQISSHIENLCGVWKNENFNIFAEEILSGTTQLLKDFELCSAQMKIHIMENQKDLEQNN